MSYSSDINKRETDTSSTRVGMLAASTTVLGSNSQNLATEIWNELATHQYTQSASSYAISYSTFTEASVSVGGTSQSNMETVYAGALGTDVSVYLNTPNDPFNGSTTYRYEEDSVDKTFDVDKAIKTDMYG